MIRGSRVVLVDDDDSVRESLPDLLREFGCEVAAFSSAEEFLASKWVGPAECLLLDVAMPNMTGPDLQRELRRRKLGTPIIFVTAQPDQAVRERVIGEGAVDCLFKPFSQAALFAALGRALAPR